MKVSVIIPNYNHAAFLKQRIESILHQTYQNFELIILDDQSTDESVSIINQYQNHPKIAEVLINTKNSGSTFKQWNKGISMAKGELIWVAESDDYCDADLLQTLIKGFNSNPAVSIAYCQSYTTNESNFVSGDWDYWTDDIKNLNFRHDFFLDGNTFIQYGLVYKNVIPNASAVIFKKTSFLKVQGVREDIKYSADWLLWLSMLVDSHIFFSSKKLNYFRRHSNSVINKATALQSDSALYEVDLKLRLAFKNFISSKHSFQLNKISRINSKHIEDDLINLITLDVKESKHKAAIVRSFNHGLKTNNPFSFYMKTLKLLLKSIRTKMI